MLNNDDDVDNADEYVTCTHSLEVEYRFYSP